MYIQDPSFFSAVYLFWMLTLWLASHAMEYYCFLLELADVIIKLCKVLLLYNFNTFGSWLLHHVLHRPGQKSGSKKIIRCNSLFKDYCSFILISFHGYGFSSFAEKICHLPEFL